MVKIRLVSYLKNIVGFSEKSFELKKPTKINDLINLSKLPENRIIVLINNRGAHLDSEISGDDEVLLLPVVGGG